jgi:hypothetical protein
MEIKNDVFWDLSPCSVLDAYIQKTAHGIISQDAAHFIVRSVEISNLAQGMQMT